MTCLACLRNCPVKAISLKARRIIVERCIHCSACVSVCPDRHYHSCSPEKFDQLKSSRKKIALVSALLPAAIIEFEPEKISAGLYQLGFDDVYLADSGLLVVAEKYRKELARLKSSPLLSSQCPPMVEYIEKYYPDLVDNLACVVSAELACARYLAKRMPGAALVLVSPCPGRGRELERNLPDAIVISFSELVEIFARNKIDPGKLPRKEFSRLNLDSGSAYIGAGDLCRAVMQSDAGIKADCAYVGGFEEIQRTLESIRLGELKTGFLELSFCKGGCAGSSGINNRLSVWQRTELAKNFIKSKSAAEKNKLKIIANPEIDLGCEFSAKRVQSMEPGNDKIKDALRKLGMDPESPHHNCRVCGYDSCREFATALIRNEAEPDFCFPALITRMSRIDEKFLRSERLANMGQIASGLAHEVNNPLGLASGYTQTLLGNQKLNKEMKEVLGLIRDEIQNAAGIIQNFLNLSRERPARFESVNFYDELAATLRLLTPRLESSGIVLNLDYMPEPVVLECDPYGIQQVLTNIFLNAWQAMPQGGTLFISVRETPDQVTIRIRDTGPGIKPEHLPRIFDPFFTTKPVGMGTGLGLTIVYKIIEQHNGDIRVKSEPGKGAEFIVTIPRSQAGAQSEAGRR